MINFNLDDLAKIKIKVHCSIYKSSYAKINNFFDEYMIFLNKSTDKNYYLTVFAHELGHILYNKFGHKGLPKIRTELTAWRIAKTILPPALFCEDRAWYSLEKYIEVYAPDQELIIKLKLLDLKPLYIEPEKLYLIQKFLYKKIKNIKIFKSLPKIYCILSENLIDLENRLNKSNLYGRCLNDKLG